MTNLHEPPCIFCGYRGPGYWQKHTHNPDCPFYEVGGEEERRRLLLSAIAGQVNTIEELRRERDDAIGRSSKWAGIAGEHGAEVDELRRENQILKEDCERLRQKLQQGPKCAECDGHGTVEKPWGTHAPCEACNGKGF